MLRKGLIYMLCLTTALGCLSACGKGTVKETTQNATAASTTVATQIPTEPTEPDDGSIKFYYDDRIAPTDLGGTEGSVIQIIDQQVESYRVGTSDLDSAVLMADEQGQQLIAVGVGTATVDVDGTQVLVRVRPAPISLFMITGHSLGAGQCGVAEQSVVCEAGQAYSTHKTATLQSAPGDMGIGYTCALKPQGIDAFAPGGGGTIGEASALAWKWNQLTGEKVWVLNAAVGGSVITEWFKGQKYYEPAVAMYRAAAQVLANEVAAGHYKLKNTAIIYHSGANFDYKNVVFDDQTMEFWYDSMVDGFKQDLAMDITGDGAAETVESIGFLPYGVSNENDDKPINFYMALDEKYDGCFMVAETARKWITDGRINDNFPAISYSATQSMPVEMPALQADVFAEDKVHFTQVAYNAAGLEIGENLYKYFRTDVQVESLTIQVVMGTTVKDELKFRRVGASVKLIVVAQPFYAADFTVTHSDNLQITSPFTVKAIAAGEGFITISKGDQVIRHISVTVSD